MVGKLGGGWGGRRPLRRRRRSGCGGVQGVAMAEMDGMDVRVMMSATVANLAPAGKRCYRPVRTTLPVAVRAMVVVVCCGFWCCAWVTLRCLSLFHSFSLHHTTIRRPYFKVQFNC